MIIGKTLSNHFGRQKPFRGDSCYSDIPHIIHLARISLKTPLMSNLTNFNFNLASPAVFGKANQRVGQTFGTGGPRAAQVAVRVGF